MQPTSLVASYLPMRFVMSAHCAMMHWWYRLQVSLERGEATLTILESMVF